MRSEGPTVTRWTKLGLAVAGRIVPARVRGSWRREWERELQAAELEGLPSSGLSLFRGMLSDAWVVRRMELRPFAGMDEEGTMMRVWTMFRQSLKGLARSPGFAALSVVTLAIGLGATAAVFSVVDHVLLRPLPYPDADELVVVQHPIPGYDAQGAWNMSVAGYFALSDLTRSLEKVGNYQSVDATLAVGERVERVAAVRASTSLYEVIVAEPALGRMFDEDDDEPDAPLVAMLAWEFWRDALGGDPDVVGSTIQLNGDVLEVIGVMQAGVELPEIQTDIWYSWRLNRASRPVNSHYVAVLGRLAEGVTLEAANAEIHDIVHLRFPEIYPGVYDAGFMEQAGFSGEVVSLRSEVLGAASRPLWAVFAAVAVVLLLAAANVANLFLVRAESRRRETAVRRALGATRGRLIEQGLGEGLAIAIVAVALGLAIASVLLPSLRAMAPEGFPRLHLIRLDLRTVSFLGLSGLLVGGLVGLIPSLAGESAAGANLRDGDRSGGKGAGSRTRKTLVALQMALAMVLLTSAGLMVRTGLALSRVQPGFLAEDAVVMDYAIPWWEISEREAVTAYLTASLDRLRDLPGVTAAGIVNQPPMSGAAGCWSMGREDAPSGDAAPCPVTRFVSDGYFEAMGIPIEEGRSISRETLLDATGEVVVSRGIADTYWGGDAMGRGIITARTEAPWHRISGIVGAVHDQGLDQPAPPTVYFPLTPVAGGGPAWGAAYTGSVVVRTNGRDPVEMIPLISEAMAADNPLVSTSNPRTLEQVVAQSRLRQTFTLTLLMAAAAIALLLGAIGLYGVVAYAVSQRRGEIGVRMALGAAADRVGLMVLRESLTLVAAGAVVGIGASLLTSRMLQGLLFGVEGLDMVTLGGVVALLAIAASLAAWIPARRAAGVAPASCLRGD